MTDKTPDHETLSQMLINARWTILQAMPEPSKAQDIAARTDLTYNNVMYHLAKLVDMGIVQVLKKGGGHERYYQRQSVFAEVLVDFEDFGELVTDASFTVTPVSPPKGFRKVTK